MFQSGAAGLGVVGEDVDTVAGTDGDEALELPFGLGFGVLQKGEFAAQDFDEEVAVAAGGLEKRLSSRNDSLRTRSSIAFTSRGLVNTSPWSATLWRLLICLGFSLSGIRKSWNFAYVLLGVPRPARQLSKAHDFS